MSSREDPLQGFRKALCSDFPNKWEIDSIQYRSKSGRYFFHACIDNDLLVRALYDPGAEVTILKESVFKAWNGHKRHKLIKTSGGLTGAFGNASDGPDLVCDLPCSAFGKGRVQRFHIVPEMNGDMIAGADMVEDFKISLDSVRRRLVTDESLEVLAVHGETIEPYESRMVDCTVASVVGSVPHDVVVEGYNEREGLFMPPILIRNAKAGETYRLPLWNFNSEPLDTRQVSSVVGRGTPAKKAVPVNDLLIGELPMPSLTPAPPEKLEYLKSKLTAGKVDASVKEDLLRLVCKYHQAFGAHPFDLGRTETHTHRIQLKDPNQTPVFTKQFPLPEAHRKVVLETIQEQLKLGVIRPCQSPWNSCVFVVPKPHGGHRVVVDMRALNEACVDTFHAGQTIEDLIQQVGELKARYFSTCDILKGFWQVPIEKASQPLTAFSLPGVGSFAYTACPMGLQGSVYAFWALANSVVYGLTRTFCYMDDLLTASPSTGQHLKDLEQLFRRIIQHKLTLNIEKCEFLMEDIQFLGFEISGKGVRPGKPKTEVLLKCPPPTSVKEIKSFLGLANFFYRHYPLQQEAKYLSVLTRKESAWKGGELPPRALQAYESIKRMLTSRPLLRYPDYTRVFHLYCDAATGTANQVDPDRELQGPGKAEEVQPGGIGCFLGQEDDQGRMYPLGYAGRGLKKHEAAYSAYLLEHLAAVYGLEQFDHMIRGYKCVLHTDHHSLTHLSNMHKKTLMRLQEMILTRNVEIAYTPGDQNGASDALSRMAYKVNAVEYGPDRMEGSYLHMLPYSTQEMKTLQREDPEVFALIKFVSKSKGWPGDPFVKRWGPQCFLSPTGVLFYKDFKSNPPKHLLVVPRALQAEILAASHESLCGGHAGVGQCQQRLRDMYFWPTLLNDAKDYVLSCDKCQKQKRSNFQGTSPIIPLPTEEQFGARVHIDLLGEISGNPECRYILVITDAYSKYADFVPVRDKSAETVAEKFWSEWVCRHGTPILVVSDGGKEFNNKFMARLLEYLGTEHRTTSPYHPQTNASAEVLNKTAARYIRSFLDHRVNDVVPYLCSLRFSYNTARHLATQKTPHELVYGRMARYGWFDPEGVREMFYGEEGADELVKRIQLAREEAVKNNMSFKDCYTHRFNRNLVEPEFKKGDLVLLHAPLMTKRELGVATNKWNSPWAGPARIKQCFPARHNALIEFPRRLRKGKRDFLAHFDRLKPYKLRPGAPHPFETREADRPPEGPPLDPIDEEEEAPNPVLDADDLLLDGLERDETEMQAWDLLHSETPEASNGPRISFDPVSPPVRVPAEEDAGDVPQPDQDPWEEPSPTGNSMETPSPALQEGMSGDETRPSPVRRLTRSMTKGLRNALAGPLDRIRRRRK